MSLAIVACDVGQAVAVSDGRAFTIIDGQKKFFRDDFSKVVQLAPHVAVAATGERSIGLFRALQDFVSAYRGLRLFEDLWKFTWRLLEGAPQDPDLAVILFGFDDRTCQMRIITGTRPNGEWKFEEIYPERDYLPAVAAIGKTGRMDLSAERFAEADPLAVMHETLDFAEVVDPEVGGRRFEFIIQAPDLLRTVATHPGRCWPILDAGKVAARRVANPPADLDDINWHLGCRLALQAAEMGVPFVSLVGCTEAQAQAAGAAFMNQARL